MKKTLCHLESKTWREVSNEQLLFPRLIHESKITRITKNAALIIVNIQILLQTSKELKHCHKWPWIQRTGKASRVLELHRQGEVLPHGSQPGKDQTPAWCFHTCTTRGQQVATSPGPPLLGLPQHGKWETHIYLLVAPWLVKAAEILINSLELRVQGVLPITMKLLKELEGSMFWFYMLWCFTARTCHSPKPSCCSQMWAAFLKANARSVSHFHLQKCCSTEVSAANPHESK